MAIEYNSRIGKTYYRREGQTKTGKPRYFFSAQQSGKGKAVSKIPEGYKIYESNADTENLKGIFGKLLSNTPIRPGINTDDTMTALVNIADQHYTAMLRFRLDD